MRWFLILTICQVGLLEAHGHHHDHEHEEFQWTPIKSEFADIEVEVAGPGGIGQFAQAPAKIVAHPDHNALVIPKAEGTVVEICKNLGDCVEKGEVLAIIESQEIAEAKSHYLLAKSKAELHQELLRREKGLIGISPEQDYLQAKETSQSADIECACAKQHLYALGLNDEDIASNERFYPLRSPLKGKVLERNLTLGEFAGEETKAYRIGNFDQVWVEMSVSQEDAKKLKVGQTIDVVSASGKHTTVRLTQFSPSIDEETRKATAIAVIENASEKWKPGQYVSALIETKKVEYSIVVPREAVQKIKGKTMSLSHAKRISNRIK